MAKGQRTFVKLKIDKGIPFRRFNEGTYDEYANKMEVGDSIFSTNANQVECIRQAIIKTGARASSTKERDGWRIWKLAKEVTATPRVNNAARVANVAS